MPEPKTRRIICKNTQIFAIHINNLQKSSKKMKIKPFSKEKDIPENREAMRLDRLIPALRLQLILDCHVIQFKLGYNSA